MIQYTINFNSIIFPLAIYLHIILGPPPHHLPKLNLFFLFLFSFFLDLVRAFPAGGANPDKRHPRPLILFLVAKVCQGKR